MKKIKKSLEKFAKILLMIILVGIFNLAAFILVMRANLYPNIQERLVTSVMVTMTHQYLAKLVATEDRIKLIMDNNKVIQTNAVTDKSAIKIGNYNYDSTNNYYNSGNNSKQSQEDTQRKAFNIKDDKVDLVSIKGSGYKGHMFIISNPKRIKLAVTNNLGKNGELLNDLIKKEKGIGGVNAGGFSDISGHGTGGIPTGIIIKDGQVLWKDKNQTEFSIIGFDEDGILTLGNYTLDEIKELNIKDAISFGPYLIVNGEPTKIIGDGGWGINPRTVIGQKADGTVLLLEIDGRQPSYSLGATIRNIQDIMLQYGAVNASNLDGGSSTVMYYNNKLINRPCSPYGQRPLPDAWIISKSDLDTSNSISSSNNSK